MFIKKLTIHIIAILCINLLFSCSIKKAAVKLIANAMTSASDGDVFMGDDDPQLIEDALPFILKLYESLLSQIPEDPKLNLSTGSSFAMYANAFVHSPAKMLPAKDFAKQNKMIKRAKKLYLRGRNYVINGIDSKYEGFKAALDKGKINNYMHQMTKEDVPFLYWAGASWIGAFATDPFDVELGQTIKYALVFMKRALELNESFDNGSIHEFFILYYGTLPAVMGGNQKKARFHFKRALKISKGAKASPFVALATTISIKNQDVKEYKRLLRKALSIDVNVMPQYRLANMISQREAQWYLDHIEDKFLIGFINGGKKCLSEK